MCINFVYPVVSNSTSYTRSLTQRVFHERANLKLNMTGLWNVIVQTVLLLLGLSFLRGNFVSNTAENVSNVDGDEQPTLKFAPKQCKYFCLLFGCLVWFEFGVFFTRIFGTNSLHMAYTFKAT